MALLHLVKLLNDLNGLRALPPGTWPGCREWDSPELPAVRGGPRGKQDTASELKELAARNSELGTLHGSFPECAGFVITVTFCGLHNRIKSRETQPLQSIQTFLQGVPSGLAHCVHLQSSEVRGSKDGSR